MKRALPALVSLLLVIGAFLIPAASPARLSALQAYELLDEPVPEGFEVGEDWPELEDGPTLWQALLEGPGCVRTEEGLVVRLDGVRAVVLDPEFGPDLLDNITARRSLVRGLRQYAEASGEERYSGLVVRGEETPIGTWGLNFLVELGPHQQRIVCEVDHPEDRPDPIEVVRDWTAPGRTAIWPPIVAVVLAILLRRPLVALLVAVLAGAFFRLRGEGADVLTSLGVGALDVVRRYLKNEVFDDGSWHVNTERTYIIGFVFFMLAMVGVMTRSGGVRGLMDAVARRAKGARGTQVATWIMGLVVFFDDYANTILVGTTMRPLTDRFKIAREKLAYIVDSTAAPVAGLSIFSTWIAFEVSTFNGQLPAAGLSVGDGYAVFLQTVPYSFYCFLTIFFVGLVALTGRDFGPMLTAERRARHEGLLLARGSTPMVAEEATAMEPAPYVVPNMWRAILPLVTFILVTLFVIVQSGGFFELDASQRWTVEGLTGVLYDGSGSWPLLVGSLAGFVVAALLALGTGIGAEIFTSAWTTIRAMAVGFAILYLAWMISAVCTDLRTAPFLTALVGDAVQARLLPTLLFLLAGAVAFATGSSWSTMGILLPLVVGFAYNLGLNQELAETTVESGRLLMVMSIGSVLSGAIFGDHCSPISDTTVMSSIASASDHIDHVRTQIPYAFATMCAAVICGYFPATYYGLNPWLGILLGCVLLTVVVLGFGKRADQPKT